MPPKKDILKLTSEVKTCVLRLSKCFNQELRCKKPVNSYESIAKRVAHALGISLRSVYKILADNSDNVQPSASVTRTSRGKVLDDFAADLLRRTVYEMYGLGEFVSIIIFYHTDALFIDRFNVRLKTVQLTAQYYFYGFL